MAFSAFASASSLSPASRFRCARTRFRSASLTLSCASRGPTLPSWSTSAYFTFQAPNSLLKIDLTSNKPELRLCHQGTPKCRSRLNGFLQLDRRPHDSVHFTTKPPVESLRGFSERLPIGLTQDEQVDVARDVVVASRVGTEDKRELYVSLARKS